MSAALARKAFEYLCRGQVRIEQRVDERIVARVQGTAPQPYLVTHGAAVPWLCSCRARGLCSHILAVALVTIDADDARALIAAPPEVPAQG